MFVGSRKRQIFDMSVIRRFSRLSFTRTRNIIGAFLLRDAEYGEATGNLRTADGRTNGRSAGASMRNFEIYSNILNASARKSRALTPPRKKAMPMPSRRCPNSSTRPWTPRRQRQTVLSKTLRGSTKRLISSASPVPRLNFVMRFQPGQWPQWQTAPYRSSPVNGSRVC